MENEALTRARVDLAESSLAEVHIAATKMENAQEDRDHAIRCAWRDGASVAAIAEQAELTRQRVYQIIG